MYQAQSYNLAAVMPEALATGLFVSRATFQAPDGVIIGAGQPSGNFVEIDGYADIQCMNAPESNLRITANEAKSLAEVESSNSGHVLLQGYYPEINDHTEWRVVITDATGAPTTFDVLGAEGDSQSKMTRVKVTVITV